MDDRTIDLIFSGSLKSLPPVSSKIVRIFTSSTFTDTTMERNTLMAKCYPRIKDYCREKHGLEFQVVDMRWGVRDEATDDHMTTELCMKEIENCQRLSMGPNFVVFLGQKYGYRPIPTYILSSELQLLRDELAAGGTDVILLDTWYRKDANAVPPISVLQPISSILVNFNNKRVPKLQAEDQAIWWDTLNKMQKLFRKAALSLFTAGKITKDIMHNYFMSVTEREVINGILNVKNTKNHCLAYVRYINNINLQNLKKASLFVDILNRSLDTEACKLLANLRDERLPAKIETTNIQKYTVEWIGREGLDPDTHGEYLNHFIAHFYRNIVKLVDRAMRKEDGSAQGQIVTELLQHLHACNNSVKVFYGREETLQRIKEYMLGSSHQLLVFYGEGGCGKTSLLAKSAALSAQEWFDGRRPVSIIRFLGTTPDSSALTPTLISICQQISYNFSLPFENIPDDLVPLTAHFKQLLCCATYEQPLLLFLDSVDQLTGAQDVSKVSWLPTRLPPFCKVLVTCACEESNPVVSREYNLLRRMIDNDDQFIEVTALGEDLATQVMKMWMKTACRDLNNYQWRLVSNAISSCSLPIFVKLVFAEVCRWRSYTKPTETKLATTVMDSIMMLFERIEKQHGRILVFHALAYITAARSGLSESELEDLISLDDKVLDDVYQYHLPPVRRIPPLLWTRIRNDLPNYLSEREADGVSVMSWYHRQFRDAARERYFKNMNMAMYFHSSIADYFLGIWGGGIPKPFKYTEIQRHRFGLTDKEGVADRKVPIQPLVFVSADGSASRYNLRKFGELPFHLVRSRRFKDLYDNVLFNYDWLHAKLRSCPLQAVLADFEDACQHIENKEATRELVLVADALRLGGAILGIHPDMLAPQLLGRLLPETKTHAGLRSLLTQCDERGRQHSALLPLHHCLHTPGGPLKYSLEGHQFAVFSFRLTSDFRYIVSISNKLITWDLSTSDMARDICPQLEGIMQQLAISPDNKWASAYTNNNQVIVLNMLSSELVTLDAPFSAQSEKVQGVSLLDNKLLLHGVRHWGCWSLQPELINVTRAPETTNEKGEDTKWEILTMEFSNLENYHLVLWSGKLEETDLRLHSYFEGKPVEPISFKSAMVMCIERDIFYGYGENNVVRYRLNKETLEWRQELELSYESKETGDALLQLKTAWEEQMLIGTTTYSFCVWDFNDLINNAEQALDLDAPPLPSSIDDTNAKEAVVLHLPHTIRNISTKMMQSNSAMVSSNKKYCVAGVRKNLYVWSLATKELIKVLDAHFGRIVQLEPLTVGRWNSVITSSIDRSVKVWNIDNIFEQVHVIDRQELPIESISLCKMQPLAVTVTRGCFGIWDLKTGKLKGQLSDSPLGAIVTHAEITPDGAFIVSAESGNFVIWDAQELKVLYRQEQPGVKQLILMEDGAKCLSISKPHSDTEVTDNNVKLVGVAIFRTVPEGEVIYNIEYPIKCPTGVIFRSAAVSADELHLIAPSVDKTGKECLNIYHAKTGTFVHRIPMRNCGIKDMISLVAMPHKPHWVAIIGADKGSILDIKTKRHVRFIPRWNGQVTKDGKYGLFAPTRGGLELLELKRGQTVKTFIPRVAEGVFSVLSTFSATNEYVLYYHSGRKTLRVFRMDDATQIAEYRVPAELTALGSTEGGQVTLGTLDGALAVLVLTDPNFPMPEYLVGRHEIILNSKGQH